MLFLVLCNVFLLAQGRPSVKKGVTAHSGSYMCDDMEQYTGVSWWYDWALEPGYIDNTDCTNTPEQERVPMSWGWWANTNITGRVPDTSEYLLGWNEPNIRDQADMTPQKAAEYWPILMAQSGGKKLVSPSASPCGGGPDRCHGNWEEWFDEFFALCENCHFDVLATHYYGDASCNVDWVISHVRRAHQKYGLPVWLTEFACPNKDPEVVLDFMSRVLPRLENEPGLERYAWYHNRIVGDGFISQSSSLMEPDRSELTPLGRFYNEYEPADD